MRIRINPALVFGFIFLIIQGAPFFLNKFHTPAGFVYLGTIHHPHDYFYYLSQFSQGKESFLLSYDLYSSEFRQAVPIGWINVVFGRLFFLLGIESIDAYQLSTTLSTALLMLTGYFLIRKTLGTSHKGILWAFLFFVFGNAYPTIVHGEQGKTILYYFNYWFNLAEPYTRFGNVPHQLIGNAAIIASFLFSLFISMQTVRKNELLIASVLLIVTGIVLGSVQPVQWILSGSIIVLSNLFFTLIKKRKFHITLHEAFMAAFPGLLIFTGGFPFALTLKNLFAGLPYSQLAAWESAQQVFAPPWYVFLAAGPVITLSVLGIIPLIKNPTRGRILMFLYFSITSFLFLSGIPRLLNFQNVRFLSVVTYLAAAILASDGVWFITSKLPRPVFFRSAIVSVYLILTIPVFWVQTSPKFLTGDTKNAFIYQDSAVIEGYNEVRKRTSIEDTFIAYWPMDVTFPGLTGRRGFMGHPLLTINNEKKNELAYFFLIGKMSQDEAEKLVVEHRINYILTFNDTLKAEYPFLKEEYKNSRLTLYKVTISN